MKICVVTDNRFIFEEFRGIVADSENQFDFYYSESNISFHKEYKNSQDFRPISLKEETEAFFSQYDLFMSLHCKQIFPTRLVNNYRCINIHPGLNPYNRGWYPQVFSILNKFPAGVTIHEMDEELDHGPIIAQQEVEIFEHETSFDVYQKIQQTEISLLRTHLDDIVHHRYVAYTMQHEGNVNYKADFERLLEIDLDQKLTFREALDLLRATTFPEYNNAFFYDRDGAKVYVSINMRCEKTKMNKYTMGGGTPSK